MTLPRRVAKQSSSRACATLLALAGMSGGACAPGAFDGLRSASQRDAETGAFDAGVLGPDDHAVDRDQAGPAAISADDAAGRALDEDVGVGSSGDPGSGDAEVPEPSALDAALDEPDSGSDLTDAATPDAVPPDMGPPAPVGESACYERFANRPVCEGFETPLAEPPWWTIEEGGEITQAAAPAHVGGGALAARSVGSGGYAFIGRQAYDNVRSGSLYLRSYVYVPHGTPLTGVIVHGMSEEQPPYGGVSILLDDTGVSVDVHPLGPGVSPVFVKSDPAIPLRRDQWNCLQLELVISPAQGSVRLRIDGQVAAMSPPTLATLPATGYRHVSAGVVYSDPKQEPIELFVDELVADTVQIPCD
jgi:hypothetical protein